MNKTTLRIMCMALVAIMIISIIVPLGITAFAGDFVVGSGDTAASFDDDYEAPASSSAASQTTSTSTSTSSSESKLTQSEVLEQMQDLEDQMDDVEDSIDKLEGDISQTEQTAAYYQQQADIYKKQVELLNIDIENKETLIRQKEAELESKLLQLQDTRALFEERITAMYLMRNESDLSILLGAEDLAASLRYSENLQQISQNDTDLIDQLRIEGEEVELQITENNYALVELHLARSELDKTIADYSAALQKANSELTQAQADLQAQEMAYGDLSEQYEKAQEEYLSFIAPGNYDFVYDGGLMSWPLPGYFGVSSDYNEYRVIFGVANIHRGIDLPAPAGAAIYAPASGLVSTIAHWSYGTVVKIDHGSGLVSICAHMSAKYVNNGDWVEKGDLIGAVGSTGNSTGNHLHFEVNLNGGIVDPRNYLSHDVVSSLFDYYA